MTDLPPLYAIPAVILETGWPGQLRLSLVFYFCCRDTRQILIENEVRIHAAGQFLIFVLFPIGILALLSQLGGITVIMGAGLFVANRVNIGKFLVAIGTGQGLFTIALTVISEIWSGHSMLANNYVIWLTSSAAGLGILFALISQSISKGQGDSIYSKILKFLLRNRS